MSRFIDKLNQLSRAAPQPMGFGTKQPTSPQPKIQLVASLAQERVDRLTGHVAGADAGLLRIARLASGVKTLQGLSKAVSDIPWGGWLLGSGQEEMAKMTKVGVDFLVFPATDTPLAIPQDDEAGRILEVEASLSEGLLRAVNQLPVDAVLIAGEQRDGYFLTWHHLMLYRRSADLLTKPLLVSIPSEVTSAELQTLWEAGVAGVVLEVTVGQPQGRLAELRQVIDELSFPSPRWREKAEPLLPRIGQESGRATIEEEEED